MAPALELTKDAFGSHLALQVFDRALDALVSDLDFERPARYGFTGIRQGSAHVTRIGWGSNTPAIARPKSAKNGEDAPMNRLSGRRIVVTGASRGVGFETTRLFLAEGAEVLGVARDAARLEAAQRRLDPEARRFTTLAQDLTNAAAAEFVAAAVAERWNAVDVLFNNAGIQIDGNAQGLTEGGEAALLESLAVNLLAPYRLCRALLPLLERGSEPRIINVSSGAGNFESMRTAGIPSYRLSKWALNGLTLLLSNELEGRVAVNAFDPGWVKTDLGGDRAPGTPDESARGALALATAAFAETGKFWKDGLEIAF